MHTNLFENVSSIGSDSNDSQSPPLFDQKSKGSTYAVHFPQDASVTPNTLPIDASHHLSFPPDYLTQTRSTNSPAFTSRPEQRHLNYTSNSGAPVYHPDDSSILLNKDVNFSVVDFQPRKYLVSLHGISSSHDILSFPFISTLGQVIESTILHPSSANSSETSSTPTSPSTDSDISTQRLSVSYVVVPRTIHNCENLNAINNTSMRLDECRITVSSHHSTLHSSFNFRSKFNVLSSSILRLFLSILSWFCSVKSEITVITIQYTIYHRRLESRNLHPY